MRKAGQCKSLPPLPTTAKQVLEVAADTNAGAHELRQAIEQDPAISGRILQYANAPAYGLSGRVVDLNTAIARVIGFDKALAIAFGMSLHQTLQSNDTHTFDLKAYHRKAVYTATLAKHLADSIPAGHGVAPGTAYMAGLLHDIGIAFLACSFPEQYRLLLDSIRLNPDIPPICLESALLEVTHQELGGTLLEAWSLPHELVVAARHHHDVDYLGKHAEYSQLIRLCFSLIRMREQPCSPSEPPLDKDQLVARLGLQHEAVDKALDRLGKADPLLDELAQRLAA